MVVVTFNIPDAIAAEFNQYAKTQINPDTKQAFANGKELLTFYVKHSIIGNRRRAKLEAANAEPIDTSDVVIT